MTSTAPSSQDRWTSHFSGLDVAATALLELEPATVRPNFDDDIWDLTGIIGRPRTDPASLYMWSFVDIENPRWRIVAKDTALALLAPDYPRVAELPWAYRTPRKPSTVYAVVKQLTVWFNWLTKQGVTSLAEVDANLCEEYFDDRRWGRIDVDSRRWGRSDSDDPPWLRSPKYMTRTVIALQALSFYGDFFQSDRYNAGFIPWEGRTPDEVAGAKPVNENTTCPVPPELLNPLLGNALYLMDVIGPHIADLVESLRADPTPWGHAQPHKMTTYEHDSVIEAIAQQRASGQAFTKAPMGVIQARINSGWDPHDPLLTLSPHPITRAAGLNICPSDWVDHLRGPLEAAVAERGILGPYARDAAQVPKADSQDLVVWSEPMTGDQVDFIRRYVFGACAVVTAALTGMRRCELAEIMPGPLNTTAIPGGGTRFRLSGKLIKGQQMGGVADEWTVIEEVARAIELASRLALPGCESLFGPANISNFAKTQRDVAAGPVGKRLGLAPIPDGPINGRMLRRTLAIEMASRPGGLLAAKIHLKHVSIVTTEGYGRRPGGAQSVFRKEVEAEEHKNRLALARAAFDDYQRGVLPTGPGARHLVRMFESVDSALRTHQTPGVSALTNDRRIENLLRSTAATLHIGAANYCWFADPSKALCLKLAKTPGATSPLIGMCDSTRCPQATHHQHHRPVWADAASSVAVFLGNPRISRPERERLHNEYTRNMRVLQEIDDAAQGSEERGEDR